MATGKKYDYVIEQQDSQWAAKITRKASSTKTVITQQKDGFKTEEEAQDWAAQCLKELTETLRKSNLRHTEQRKNNDEIRRQRSSRRATKTEQAKAKLAAEKALEESEIDGE